LKTIKSFCGVLAVLALTACSNNDEATGNDSHLWDVTLTASMGGATNRALSEGKGNTLTATFAENDKVVVVDADGKTIVGTLQAQSAGASTTLSGTLDESSLSVGEVVTLRYLSAEANYDDQKGTLDGISASQDYAEGTLTVSSKSPLTFTTTNVTLTSKQSITKFSFTDGTDDVMVNTFGIAATGLVQHIATNGNETVGAVTGTLPSPSADVYVALRNNSGAKQTYSFYIKDNAGNWYTGTKSANLGNGKNYTATVQLQKLPALTSSSAIGDIGVLDGRPAIVANIKGTRKAIALINDDALCPEDFGGYHAFDSAPTGNVDNGWYIPTETDLDGLDDNPYTWSTQNGVNGCLFTIGQGNTLFLPAAGYYDDEYNPSALSDAGTGGFYWSSTDDNDDQFATNLHFNGSGIENYTTIDYKIDHLSIRRFHTLPGA